MRCYPAGPVALVFGATGRTGREVVDSLLSEGFDVVAAVRNATKATDVFGAKMTASATPGMGLLDVKDKVDVTDPSTLGPAVFEDVQHVRPPPHTTMPLVALRQDMCVQTDQAITLVSNTFHTPSLA